MNAIFRLGEKNNMHEALCRVINELDLEYLFILCRTDSDLSAIKHKVTETYFRTNDLNKQYKDKFGGDDITPLDKTTLDAFSPYLFNVIKMYERMLDIVSGFDERMIKIWKHVEYWNHIITKYNVNLVVFHMVPHEIYEYIIYALCKIKNVKIAFTYFNPLYSHSYVMTDIEDHCSKVKCEYQRLQNVLANIDIEKIYLQTEYENMFKVQIGSNDAEKTPFYMKTSTKKNEKIPVENKLISLKRRTVALNKNFKKHGVLGYINNIYLPAYKRDQKHFKNLAKMEKEVKKYFSYWDSKCENFDYKSGKYIYFPLHMQPECTTLPLGGWFSDQLLAIKILANNLPDDVFILVKENPKQTMRARSKMFVDEIYNIKNVKLLPRNANTYLLTENSLAVASITGTVIWEAIFKSKPAIMFGHFITEYAPGVFYVSSNEECKHVMNKILNEQIIITQKDLKIFMLAMQNCSLPGNLSPELPSTASEMYKLFEQALNNIGVYLS